jgi:hypothetical protein
MYCCLENILLSERKDPLSNEEIDLLFKEENPERNFLLRKALISKKINPDLLLASAIENAKTKEDLISISLALRFGANPNLYIKTPEIGNIHIMGFSYCKLYNCDNLNLLNSIIITLKDMGSNDLLPIFEFQDEVQDEVEDNIKIQENQDDIKIENEEVQNEENGDIQEVQNEENEDIQEVQNEENEDIQEVQKWVKERFVTILPFSMNDVKAESSTLVGTFLDDLNLIKTPPKLDDILIAYSDITLNKYLKDFDSETGLKDSIRYLNLFAYKKFAEKKELKYFQINDLLLKMKNYTSRVPVLELFDMLLYSIERGSIIDEYQYKMLEKINPCLALKLKKSYEVPIWKKNCFPEVCKEICTEKNKDERDEEEEEELNYEMKRLAYCLNLNPEYPKSVVCSQIHKISLSDPKEVKKSVLRRQETRITSTLSNYLSYINNEPKIIIKNSSSSFTGVNVYDYPDNDICFYKDVDENSWVFTRNDFNELVLSRKNPDTGTDLPILLIEEMEKRRDYYNSLFFEDEMIPISQTIDNLNKPDKIKKDTRRVNNFYKLTNVNESQLKEASKEKMESLLRDITGEDISLQELTKEHALNTFIIVIEEYIRKDPLLLNEISFLNF